MVGHRHLLALALLLLLPLRAFGAELAVMIDSDRVEMGKYLNARIVYTGPQVPPLANLGQWDDAFHVDRRDSESVDLPDGRIRTTEQLRLYPRRPGELLLESLALGGAIAPPRRIQAFPAVRNGIDGTPHWLALPESVWQGQSFDIGIEVGLMQPSNQIKVGEFSAPGFDVRPLPRQEDRTGRRESVTLRWRLIAMASGMVRIEAPVIEQRGHGRWRFHLSDRTVRILPLPSYIPPTVPVGNISVETGLIESKGPPQWTIRVMSEGTPAGELYGVRTRLAALADTTVDGVSVSAGEDESGATIRTFRVPVPAWSWRLGDGPTVSIPYFDTASGQLRTDHERLPPLWRMPGFAWVILALLVAGLLGVLSWYGIHMLCRLRDRYRCRQRLEQAQGPHRIRQLLLASGRFHSLSEWARHQPGRDAAALAADLNELCFSTKPSSSLETIRKRALEYCLGGPGDGQRP